MRWKWALPVAPLVGCAGLIPPSPNVDFQVIVEAVRSCETPPISVSTPSTAMEVGFNRVKVACEVFFTDATRAQQEALSTNSALDAGLVGATAIVSATSSAAAAAKAITVTTAGVVFGKALITQYINVYAFNTYLYKIRQFVKDSMEDYITTARANPPINYCIAYSYVSDLASLCSLAAMKAYLDQQVALPSKIANTPPAPGAGTPGARANRLLRRPNSYPSTNYTVRPAY